MKTAGRNLLIILFFCLMYALTVNAQQEIPEAAKEHFKAGVSLIEKAEKPADFLDAMTEFEAAAALAPQWPDIHYNLAKLAAESDKPAKAIKEYLTYLTLQPEAADRTQVEGEIARMKEMIIRKRKIGLPGVKFAAVKDGIVVIEIFPGARIAKTGLQQGDMIVSVDPPEVTPEGVKFAPASKKSDAVRTLDDFFKEIERCASVVPAIIGYDRMASRFGGRNESGALMILTIIRGGDRSHILIRKSMFQSNVIEIEEEEFESEVLKESLPVVVTFWNSGCEPCREFTPIIEAESAKYASKIKFVNINVDENKKLAQQLAVKGIPTIMVFKSGVSVSTDIGRLSSEKVTAILNSAAVQ